MSLSTLRREIVERQRMPLSCSINTSGATPHRIAAEAIRHAASDWAGQPPAFPKFAKTSHNPCSSWFTETYSFPHPIEGFRHDT